MPGYGYRGTSTPGPPARSQAAPSAEVLDLDLDAGRRRSASRVWSSATSSGVQLRKEPALTETSTAPAVTEHSGVIDTDKPMPYSVLVFRDPDNIQLELFYMAG